jgi:DNA repair protein RecN (Recombination protein N)
VYQALYMNEQGGLAAGDLLGKSESTLQDMLHYDPQIQPILELVTDALAQAQEAGRQISIYGDNLETDPQRLQDVEERIIELKQICRKYGPTLADAIAHLQASQAELADLTNQEASLEALEQTYQARQTQLVKHCAALTELRRMAAHDLETKLIAALKPLAMEKVQFQVQITPITPAAMGADRIQFLFSPNPGEPLQPLSETASGGEMSRFLLALKTSFAGGTAVETLIFDEIDVGVSGRVTQAIAQNLHQLGQQQQILCVTHQPIVAAMADHHFRVTKQVTPAESANGHPVSDDDDLNSLRTVVRVTSLASDQRREELAQLAGGQSGHETIAFADSLLAQAATLRQNLTTPLPSKAKTTTRATKKSRRN